MGGLTQVRVGGMAEVRVGGVTQVKLHAGDSGHTVKCLITNLFRSDRSPYPDPGTTY